MHVRANVVQEFLHVLDVIVQMERARFLRHHAGVGPVGDEDFVILQQALHGVAQQRGVMPRQWCHHQHGRLALHESQSLGSIGEALEAQQAAEGLLDGHLLLHCHFNAVDLDAADAKGRLLVVLGQTVQQIEPRRHALRLRRVAEWRQWVLVELGRCAGELGERRHQRALGLVQLIKHFCCLLAGAGAGCGCGVEAVGRRPRTWPVRNVCHLLCSAAILVTSKPRSCRNCLPSGARQLGVNFGPMFTMSRQPETWRKRFTSPATGRRPRHPDCRCSMRPRRCGLSRARRCRCRCAGVACAACSAPSS